MTTFQNFGVDPVSLENFTLSLNFDCLLAKCMYPWNLSTTAVLLLFDLIKLNGLVSVQIVDDIIIIIIIIIFYFVFSSLLNQKWNKPEMQKVANSLAGCPALSVLE